MIEDLAALLAPVTPEKFFAEHHDKAPLHVRGNPGKFAQVLSWRQINRLLDMSHIWTSTSLKLVLDSQAISAEQFCSRATSRDNAAVMQPDAKLVQGWIAKGASVVMNDVDSLTPGLAGISAALEGAGLGKAQANVYISWQSHKAFHTHYDTHDVWAVQVEGEKSWNIWEGRAEYPIPHPAFRGQPQSHHDQARGKLRGTVHMKPGDLLYLPRGWYHDALAEAPSSVHVAYGVHAPLGMDLMNMLAERVLYDAEFRKPLPRQDGSAAAQFALTQRAGLLGQRLQELCRDPKVMQVLAQFVANYRFSRGGYDILAARGLATTAAATAGDAPGWRILAPGAKPVRRGADWVVKGAQGAVTVSPPEAEATAWLLARPEVTQAELSAQAPGIDAAALLARLEAAGLLARAA
ncbi:cupin domain-containing protein [Falsiroseomonas stagni]|uniref:Ribosomal protein L16 Arg81 hydroxylase, contains JmjC domain n=1 Tax=Falsiroseomonas stagni DSM 19981 TaxID=1123062 RepID=A0A1I3X9S9_9PROT|nr:cupin domain-containing protein [Falsiroseomonas stagni]SFK15771.1 Ribosomal protein L16 Arg81 hydroxylase, contains JmjC domain [Falsiroseomonas stagni DSM 19981]